MWSYYLAGVLASIIEGSIIFFVLIDADIFITWWIPFIYLPVGFLAGFAGSWLDKNATKTTLHKPGLVILIVLITVILSFFFSLVYLKFFIPMPVIEEPV